MLLLEMTSDWEGWEPPGTHCCLVQGFCLIEEPF